MDEGDRIEISRSHELRIDGDQNWIGIKASTRVRPEENWEQAYVRLSRTVEQMVDMEIDRTVEYVRRKT